MRYLCVVLTLLAMPLPAGGQVQEFVFENGLKLLVKEDHRAPVVVSQVWYKVGGSYEHPGITGISHALEHMMFQGTEKYPGGEFSRIIAEQGGRDNAFTGADYTAYHQTLEKSRLAVSFELEADRMRNLLLEEQDFTKEMEVVKEERRLRTEDRPSAYLYEAAMATAWQTSPYRHPVVGWMADLNAMTRQDLQQWYQRWYAPNNAIVVVVGDVVAAEVYTLAKQYFADLPMREIRPPRPRPEVRQAGMKRLVVKRPARLPSLLMVYKVPSYKTALQSESIADWEPYALEVLNYVLSGSSSSRFARYLVRGAEVAATASASYSLIDRLDGRLLIRAVPVEGKRLAELERAIYEQIDLLQTRPVTQQELERVKIAVVAADIYEKDSIFYQALVLGMLEANGLGWQRADEYVEKIKAVTARQVMAVAKKYLQADGLTVAMLEPLPLVPTAAQRAPSAGGRHGR